jgi:hypothetical protein
MFLIWFFTLGANNCASSQCLGEWASEAGSVSAFDLLKIVLSIDSFLFLSDGQIRRVKKVLQSKRSIFNVPPKRIDIRRQWLKYLVFDMMVTYCYLVSC